MQLLSLETMRSCNGVVLVGPEICKSAMENMKAWIVVKSLFESIVGLGFPVLTENMDTIGEQSTSLKN